MAGPATRARRAWLPYALLAVATYLPLLATQRGDVAADSKQLLFVDPARYLAGVPSLWDPSIGLGTVTHQNIGYLFPVGPFFWLGDAVGLPMWVTQRLWLGTVLFAAGAGVLFLARTLRWSGAGPLVAAFAYALTPFTLQYSTHLSVLLLPYAALPWLVACTIRAVRAGGWRWPAWFAIGVAAAGSINATALACVLLGPVLVLGFSWVQERDTRRVLAAAGRIALLSAAVSVWWAVALLVESRYGVNWLAFSESLETVTIASSAPEVLRGLGYWFFYGRDGAGPYLDAANPYMATLLLSVSFVPMLAAVTAAWTLRWRLRGVLVTMVAAGTVLAVGAHPYDDPSPYGRLFRSVLDAFEPAAALRSITRVGPVIVLALALLLGAGVHVAIARAHALSLAHARTIGRAVAIAAVLLVLVVAWPLYRGDAVSSTRVRPEALPEYWRDAASASGVANTRTLEIPGIDFAAYDWGYAHDSITPGLTDRPTVAREVVAWGGEAAIDLMQAFDGRIQNRALEPDSVEAIARLISAGDVIWRGDLDTARYQLPDPNATRDALDAAAGLTQVDEPGDTLARYRVSEPRTLERATSARDALIVSGNGDGLVDLAGAGFPFDGLVVYSGSLAGRPDARRQLLGDGARVVVTDSNRKRASRTKTLFGNDGYTERAGETPLRDDTEDSRVDLFPDAGDNAKSVTVVEGPTARATSYGNPVWLVPADRPMLAVDGDPSTAWRTGDFWRTEGERIEVDTRERVTTDRVTLLQAPGGNRTITRVRLSFDGGDAIDADLGAASHTTPGQTVRFPSRAFRTLGVEILATDPPDRANNAALDGVGFAEITIPGVAPAVEYVRLPTDVLDHVGTRDDLTYLMSRQRQAALPATATPTAIDAAELRLAREFRLPAARQVELRGLARPAAGSVAPPVGCRSDLLTLDGAPLPVEILVRPDDDRWVVVPCDTDPVTLAAGAHRLLAADGRTTGVDLDQLTVTSPPEETARRAPTTARAPRIEVVDRGRTSSTLDVSRADDPFWLVLGQSHNAGWAATADGRGLGAPLLVDGYANGWYVEPTRDAFTVTLTWTPQRWVWIGLGISALGLLACVALVIAGRRPATRLGGATDGRIDARPALVDATDLAPPPASTARVVATVVGAGIATAVFVGPLAGLAGAVGALLLLTARRGRIVVAAASVLALVATVAYIAISQRVDKHAADFPWPGSFDAVHRLALVGIALLAIDAVVHRGRDR